MRQLTETEHEELTRWSRSRTLAARDVFVASLILALAYGKSYTEIEGELNTSRPTIAAMGKRGLRRTGWRDWKHTIREASREL